MNCRRTVCYIQYVAFTALKTIELKLIFLSLLEDFFRSESFSSSETYKKSYFYGSHFYVTLYKCNVFKISYFYIELAGDYLM